eukprot:764981-Hanusia_phi.AAC.1
MPEDFTRYYPAPSSNNLTWSVCLDACPASALQMRCILPFKTSQGQCPESGSGLGYLYCLENNPLCDCGSNTQPSDSCCTGATTGQGSQVITNNGPSTVGVSQQKPYAFCFVTYASAPMSGFNRCVPSVGVTSTTSSNSTTTSSPSAYSNAIISAINSPSETFAYLSDQVQEHKWIIVAAGGIALVIAFIYAFFLKIFGAPISYIILIATWLVLAAALLVLSIKAHFINRNAIPGGASLASSVSLGPAQANQGMTIAAAVVLGVGLIAYTLVLFIMIPRIHVAIKVIGIATECLAEVPTMLLLPVFQWMATVVLFVWWIFVFLYLASSGSWDEKGHQFVWDATLQRVIIYHFFGLLWGRTFILAVGNLIIAGATAEWFLAFDKRSLVLPLLSSAKRTLFYHCGTAAFGSLIIAIVQFIRWVFRYYVYKLKKMNPNNPLNAYIQTAIRGTNFLVSAKAAFMLILRNCLRIGTLNVMTAIFIAIGRLFIAIVSTFICALIMVGGNYNDVTAAPVFPVLIVGMISFSIASAFMDVWDMCIDTIFQCYCMDIELGTGKTPGKLKQVVADHPPSEDDAKTLANQI